MKVSHIPNALTLLRVLLTPVFLYLLYLGTPDSYVMSFFVFLFASLSDWADGTIARRYGYGSEFGKFMDPLADKVLVCGAFVLFTGPGFVDATGHNVTEVSAWMVVVIVGRELLVTGLRGFNESMGKAFGASLHGKLKMWMQSIAAPAILFIIAHEQAWGWGDGARWTKLTLAWLTLIVTALSTVQYLIRSRYILEESAPT